MKVGDNKLSYTNTRDQLGEQETFDALIEHRLTSLVDDGISKIRMYGFSNQEELISVNLPNATDVGNLAYYSCTALKTIEYGKQFTIRGGSFQNNYQLDAIILRTTDGVCYLDTTSVFGNTPISVCKGFIYVPRSMLYAYRNASNWRNFKNVIQAIEDMPVNDCSTISMSWSQIKAAIDNESFFTMGYSEGDIKKIEYTHENSTIGDYAEIAKINVNDGYVDFVIRHITERMKFNSNSVMSKYSDSDVKARLDEIYQNELQSDLKSVITPVKKYYYSYDEEIDEVTAPLWLLNSKDVNASGSYLKETEGENYTIFNSNTNRTKKQTYSPYNSDYWLLGTAYSNNYPMAINGNGGVWYAGIASLVGLVFGFRIKKSS